MPMYASIPRTGTAHAERFDLLTIVFDLVSLHLMTVR